MAEYLQSLMGELDAYRKREEGPRFPLVVVPTVGIKADVLSAYASGKRAGAACWSVPAIRTWEEHLRHVWRRSRREFKGRRLLTSHEFRYHWMNAGLATLGTGPDEKGEADDFSWMRKYVSRVCDDAIRTWKLLNDYRIIPLRSPQQHDDSVQAFFFRWVGRYCKSARERGWLSEPELAGELVHKLRLPHFMSRYGTPVLFLTLPWQETIRHEYIREYVKAASEAGLEAKEQCLLTLARRGADEGRPSFRALEFADTNRELQAAAAQAREWLEQEIRERSSRGGPQAVRIGIVVPNPAAVQDRIRRQFLATFCPNGHWACQTPPFMIRVHQSLADTPVCREVLSYLRVRHAGSIVYSKARALVHSAAFSGVVPESDLEELRRRTGRDQEIDSEMRSPWGRSRADRRLAGWMERFGILLAACRNSLKARRRADFRQVFGAYLRTKRRLRLDELIEAFTALDGQSGKLVIDSAGRECTGGGTLTGGLGRRVRKLDVLSDDPVRHRVLERLLLLEERLLNGAEEERPAAGDRALSVEEETRLSRLDGLIERLGHDSVVCRMIEIAREVREIAARERARMGFEEAYDHLSSACAAEPAPTAAPPRARPNAVEVLSLQQATGRRFSHLWFLGMRDTDWPPPVRPNRLVDPCVLRDKAPSLYCPEGAAERADQAFGAVVDCCEARDDIRMSYAIRDAGVEREFIGADSIDLRGGSPEAGDGDDGAEPDEDGRRDASPVHEPVHPPAQITWEFCETPVLFHPSCSAVAPALAPALADAVERSRGLNDPVEPERKEKKWADAEYATQFECPFRAFAIHRLGIAARPSTFGSAAVAERRDVVKDFRKKWKKRGLRPIAVRRGGGLFKVRIGTEDFVLDGGIDLRGRYAPKHLKVGKAGRKENHGPYPVMSNIAEDSFREFEKGRRLYPLQVLRWAARSRSTVVPGYVSSETLDGVKHIGGSLPSRRKIKWLEKREDVKKVVELTEDEYNGGVLAPDPVGEEAAPPGSGPAAARTGLRQVAEICRHCHLQDACRYDFVDEPAW